MNAYELLNNTYTDLQIPGNSTPITTSLNKELPGFKMNSYPFENTFNANKINNAVDLANANAEMVLRQNYYKYAHDEAIANTAVQRRVADLLKAGLNPYLANGLFGGNNGFSGEVPNAAAIASSGESKQKLDWRSFLAQSGMNMLQQIMSGVMSGFSLYQTQKAIMKAREDAKNNKKDGKDVNLDPSYGEMIKDNLVNGAAGLRDGLMEIEKFIPAIIGAIFGNFNPNYNTK